MAGAGSGLGARLLSADRWGRVEELFQHLVDLESEAERAAVLAGVDDVDLKAELESLLASHLRSTAALRGVLRASSDDAAPDPTWVGRRVGAYRVLSELDRGGMSRVYLARRDDQEFEKQVVIKTVEPDLLSPALVRRFLQERQILASLSHPGIAALLDGSTTEEGVPYLVMEHVDGLPIDRYCDEHRLSISARIKIFLGACAAVEEAHRRLIIHRDVKPGNILVNANGVAKLLDFGIAKLLEPVSSAGPVHTEMRPMTPRYASPEQAAGLPLSTATDVFSLGVVLYELLAGVHPFLPSHRPQELHEESRWLASRPATLLRRTDPSSTSTTLERVADCRSCSARALMRQLGGDLEAILLKAIKAEPAARYASVAALAEDLQRYTRHRPVAARRLTPTHRALKLLWRHPLATALTAGAAALLVAAGLQLARAEQRAALERDSAEQALSFLTGVFQATDPYRAGQGPVTLREVLDTGLAKVDNDLRDKPALQARMLDVLAEVYRTLGETESSLSASRRAVQLTAAAEGAESPAMAERLRRLGKAYLRSSKYEEARANLETAYRLSLALTGKSSTTAETLVDLGSVAILQGRLPEANTALREAMEVLSSNPRERLDREILAEAHAALSHLRRKEGRLEESEAAIREALRLTRELHGDLSPKMASVVADLSVVLAERGETEAAIEQSRQAIRIWKGLFPDGHPEIARILQNLSVSLGAAGRFEDAEAALVEALPLMERFRGPEHVGTAFVLDNLAALLLQLHETDRAEAPLRRALAIRRKLVGESHPMYALSLTRLGELQRLRGELEPAEASFNRATAILTSGEANVALPAALAGLGRIRVVQGRLAEAEDFFRQALAARTRLRRERVELLGEHELDLAICLAASGQLDRALAVARAAMDRPPQPGSGGAERARIARDLTALLEEELQRGTNRASELQRRALLERWITVVTRPRLEAAPLSR